MYTLKSQLRVVVYTCVSPANCD